MSQPLQGRFGRRGIDSDAPEVSTEANVSDWGDAQPRKGRKPQTVPSRKKTSVEEEVPSNGAAFVRAVTALVLMIVGTAALVAGATVLWSIGGGLIAFGLAALVLGTLFGLDG